jgi:PEP-CTERM motif-containing protein
MKKILLSGLLFLSLTQTSQAALIGSQLSVEAIFQLTPSSPIETIGFLTTATVIDPGIEFPSFQALEVPGAGLGTGLVDTSVDVGDNFIEIDFDNTSPFTSFASAFQNTLVFTFDSLAAISITGATIDTGVTTLGLTAGDVTFSGNQLSINVEGLSFNTSTFVQIDLLSEGGPSAVPLPSAIWLFGSGLLGLLGFRRQSK